MPAQAANTLQLQVAGLTPGASLPLAQAYNRGGCHGANHSPQLRWSHAPAGTRSFAITLFDPNARNGRGWWHWVVWNIPARAHGLPDNAAQRLPKNVHQSHNDFGSHGYGGPCPPPGETHHYVITVYALGTASLSMPADTPPAKAARHIQSQAIAHTSATFLYTRQQPR